MEREFIQWLSQTFPNRDQNILVGIGDDAAVIDVNAFDNDHANAIVMTTDAISDGTHFDLQEHALDLVGRKAMAVNLSDMAAMGAYPLAATVSYTLPQGFKLEQAQNLFLGSQKLASEFGFEIVGGDTNVSHGPLVVSITLLGSLNKNRIWKMSTARAGDKIMVSGRLGGSILGHHLNFQPRVRLAVHLSKHYEINCATDLSDSLSLDLHACMKASGTGAVLDLDSIPVSDAAVKLSQSSGQTVLQHALGDGEDFELLFTVPQEMADRMMNDRSMPTVVTTIGTVVEQSGLWFEDNGELKPLTPTGYSH